MATILKSICAGFIIALAGCSESIEPKTAEAQSENCPVELVVLGIGQDAGAPQIGNPNDPAWKDPSKRLWATSLALIDHENQKRYLFEATPDIREQIQYLDKHFPVENKTGLGIDGIFLTHAHIGHYAGLMFLGRESAGTQGVPVYVMPRMKEYLESNGPWSQLVELGNIEVMAISEIFYGFEEHIPDEPIEFTSVFLNKNVLVRAERVPHRDEYSETVGYLISGPNKEVGFIPDIDHWDNGIEYLQTEEHVASVDYAFIDATFYDDNELPGRDMSQIPHPRVTESMDLIDAAGDDNLKDKVRFIHINHTNPLRDKTSGAYQEMTRRGYKRAYRGERFCL